MELKIVISKTPGTLKYHVEKEGHKLPENSISNKDRLKVMEILTKVYLDLRGAVSDNKGEL